MTLRNALEARGAEAVLYRKQYEGLCRKLDSLEEHQRQASTAARAKVSHGHIAWRWPLVFDDSHQCIVGWSF